MENEKWYQIIGKMPLCNRRPDRAPHVCGYCFFLCWRCTALISTILFCSLISWIVAGNRYANCMGWGYFLMGSSLILPTLWDGLRQYLFHKESTNRRRCILGIISGIGLWLVSSVAHHVLVVWYNRWCFV